MKTQIYPTWNQAKLGAIGYSAVGNLMKCYEIVKSVVKVILFLIPKK